MTKKICIISTISQTMEEFVIDSAKHLQDNGYEISLICSMNKEFLNKYDSIFNCINIEMKRGITLKTSVKAIFEFYKFFKNNNFDIVEYSTPNASFYASIASFCSGSKIRIYKQWGIRYVGFSGMKRKLFRSIEKFICTISTHIRAVSYKNMEFGIEEGLYPRHKVKVIGKGGTIGVDLVKFNHEKKELWQTKILNNYPQIKDKIVLGFLGRLTRDKGINELLTAYIALSMKYTNIILLLMGPMENNENDIDTELLTWAKNNDLVIFTDWITEIPEYLSVVDILIHPSYREGFSMVIQQAQALKIPVITTNIPGPSEVIEEGVTGLLVKHKDASSLQRSIEMLIENAELRFQFGENGLVRVKKYFQRTLMLEQILEDRNSFFNEEQ